MPAKMKRAKKIDISRYRLSSEKLSRWTLMSPNKNASRAVTKKAERMATTKKIRRPSRRVPSLLKKELFSEQELTDSAGKWADWLISVSESFSITGCQWELTEKVLRSVEQVEIGPIEPTGLAEPTGVAENASELSPELWGQSDIKNTSRAIEQNHTREAKGYKVGLYVEYSHVKQSIDGIKNWVAEVVPENIEKSLIIPSS